MPLKRFLVTYVAYAESESSLVDHDLVRVEEMETIPGPAVGEIWLVSGRKPCHGLHGELPFRRGSRLEIVAVEDKRAAVRCLNPDDKGPTLTVVNLVDIETHANKETR